MQNIPFRIKICGVRTGADVIAAAAAGADAVGLNCFAKSDRFVTIEQAGELAAKAASLRLMPIGLFVNHSLAEIGQVVDRCNLLAVQIHGDEPVSIADKWVERSIGVLRAIRLPVGPLEPAEIESRIATWEKAGCWVLLDADVGAAFGGEGQVLDWDSIGRWADWRSDRDGERPTFGLAGGLRPETVAEAIERTGATMVDVASGVEREKGVKDPTRIREFCLEAKKGFGLGQA